MTCLGEIVEQKYSTVQRILRGGKVKLWVIEEEKVFFRIIIVS